MIQHPLTPAPTTVQQIRDTVPHYELNIQSSYLNQIYTVKFVLPHFIRLAKFEEIVSDVNQQDSQSVNYFVIGRKYNFYSRSYSTLTSQVSQIVFQLVTLSLQNHHQWIDLYHSLHDLPQISQASFHEIPVDTESIIFLANQENKFKDFNLQ